MGGYGKKGKTADLIDILVHAEPSTECIFWPFGRDGQGYGRALMSGYTSRLAHRIVCEIMHGSPTMEGHYARHLCGNGHLGCVNPGHLAWGTPKDNQDDELKLGRRVFGGKTTKAVLSEEDIPVIRRMRFEGLSYQKIGDKFGVQRSTIQAIAEGRTWMHVA